MTHAKRQRSQKVKLNRLIIGLSNSSMDITSTYSLEFFQKAKFYVRENDILHLQKMIFLTRVSENWETRYHKGDHE